MDVISWIFYCSELLPLAFQGNPLIPIPFKEGVCHVGESRRDSLFAEPLARVSVSERLSYLFVERYNC